MAKRKRLGLKIVSAVFAVILIGAYLWGNDDRFFVDAPQAEQKKAFAEEIGKIRQEQKWTAPKNFEPKLTRDELLQSAELGCNYLVANQRPEGNFNYEYDFTTKTMTPGDNQVRQAGALWGVALCYQHLPSEKMQQALDKGFDFFFQASQPRSDGALIVYYPGDQYVLTGTISLVSLALIEYLRAATDLPAERRELLMGKLDGYLKFLQSQQFDSGTFSTGLVRGIGMRIGKSNPYFDGETFLAMCKAAKYLGKTDLVPIIEKAAAAMAIKYTVDAWEKEADSTRTKGFYQWGSMSFWEYQDAGWTDAPVYADTALAMAWWMIYTHHILNRTRNTGYAYEGLIHSYEIATHRNDPAMVLRLRHTIDRGLRELTSWQVEGPLVKRNKFLLKHRTSDPLAIGGVMNHRKQAPLRIDVGQHQMHAVLLALKYVYTE